MPASALHSWVFHRFCLEHLPALGGGCLILGIWELGLPVNTLTLACLPLPLAQHAYALIYGWVPLEL